MRTGIQASESQLAEATRALVSGLVVAIPTDTVYGLAVAALHPGATGHLYTLKGRPSEVRLPVLVADEGQALDLADAVPASARRLMRRFWPGALTLVLPRRPALRAELGPDDTTIGVRCPAYLLAVELCRAAGPLATTSANLHGEEPLTTAADVRATFGDAVAVVLDGGTCEGLPSTVVDCIGPEPRLLRSGRVPWEDVVAAANGGSPTP